jgi:hypothetical protein
MLFTSNDGVIVQCPTDHTIFEAAAVSNEALCNDYSMHNAHHNGAE